MVLARGAFEEWRLVGALASGVCLERGYRRWLDDRGDAAIRDRCKVMVLQVIGESLGTGNEQLPSCPHYLTGSVLARTGTERRKTLIMCK